MENVISRFVSRPTNWTRSLVYPGLVDLIGRIVSRSTNWMRSLAYPGLDLHTRNRASLGAFWKEGPRDVLDAGSGNAYFWLAYQSGARVFALNFDKNQVEKARDFLFSYSRADKARLEVDHFNLYDLRNLSRSFDEIICYETLEHIKGDSEMLRQFFRILKPGRQLNLCCPYSLHPHHRDSELDLNEAGGHVRAGYTREDYSALLTPIGFKIDKFRGIGSPSLYRVDNLLRAIRVRLGDVFALPIFPLLLPFVWRSHFDPIVPFSLYVRAIKPYANNRADS